MDEKLSDVDRRLDEMETDSMNDFKRDYSKRLIV